MTLWIAVAGVVAMLGTVAVLALATRGGESDAAASDDLQLDDSEYEQLVENLMAAGDPGLATPSYLEDLGVEACGAADASASQDQYASKLVPIIESRDPLSDIEWQFEQVLVAREAMWFMCREQAVRLGLTGP